MNYVYRSFTVLAFALALCLSAGAAVAGEQAIADGSKVSLEYTLQLEDGTVVDTNVGKEPLVYEQGKGMLIPGLETRLEGMKADDTATVEVPADEAYGKVNPDAYEEVPKENVPAEALKVGSMLKATTADGRTVAIRVHEIKDETVVMDLNHPLAGKNLTFDVKILDVK